MRSAHAPASRVVVAAALAAAIVAPALAVAQQRPALPDLGGTEITLSWADFKRLVEATSPPPVSSPTPPRPAILRSAEYRGRIAGGVLTLDATLLLDVLSDGWARLPLWTAGSLVSFDGGGAVLARTDNGVEVVARGPRSYTLTARIAFSAPDRPGENRLALELPDAPLNLLEVAIGDDLRDLGVETGLAYRRLPDRVYAALAGGRATLSYTVPYRDAATSEGEEVVLEPRVLVTAAQFLNLGDGVIGGILVLDYRVRIAPVTTFELAFEDGIEVFDAAVPGLESWKVLQREDRRVLQVRLASPTDGDVRVVVTFDGSYDAAAPTFAVPRFELLGIEREAGFVAVAADGAEVELSLAGNLLPADPADIPPDVRAWGGNLVAAAKYAGAPARATVTVAEHSDAAVLTAIIDRLNASTLLLADGTEASWIDLTVTSNRRQFLRLELPADDVEVWSLLVDGEPARPKLGDGRVLLPLPTAGAEHRTQVSLVLLRRTAAVPAFGTIQPTLPGFDVPISEAMWTVYLPPQRRYRPLVDGFRLLLESSPLLAAGPDQIRFRSVAEPLAAASAPASEAKGYPSDELARSQVAQEQQIQQQVAARQGASRRGALPVRIGLPGGVAAMARVDVGRILVVETAPTALPIRVYPGWLRAALRWIQWLAIAAAGVLGALALDSRDPRRRRWWLVGCLLVAVLPIGGLSPLAAVTASIATAVIGAGVARIARRRGLRHALATCPEDRRSRS